MINIESSFYFRNSYQHYNMDEVFRNREAVWTAKLLTLYTHYGLKLCEQNAYIEDIFIKLVIF